MAVQDDDEDEDDDDNPFGPAVVELNLLDAPVGTCEWDKGCIAPATHNLVQYDAFTAMDMVEGVDENYCQPHAIAMKARLEEWE